MDVLLLAVGLLFLIDGLIRVIFPRQFTGLRIRLLEDAHWVTLADWLRRNERLVRPIGVLITLIGAILIYLSL